VTERRSPLGNLPLFCACVLAICTVVLAGVALFVWPKLFAATPDGVAPLVSAGCDPEPGPAAGFPR
jgi:hypothetical protein